jgi:hypothetical protein
VKLNAAEIREIEKFLTAREKGMMNKAIGAYFGLGDFGAQKASTTFKTLATIGVRVSPTKTKPGPKAGSKYKPRSPARPERYHPQSDCPQPARLTAEQWQERLSVHGF